MRSLRKIVIILIIIGFMYLLIVVVFMFGGFRMKLSENVDIVLILGVKVNGILVVFLLVL